MMRTMIAKKHLPFLFLDLHIYIEEYPRMSIITQVVVWPVLYHYPPLSIAIYIQDKRKHESVGYTRNQQQRLTKII